MNKKLLAFSLVVLVSLYFVTNYLVSAYAFSYAFMKNSFDNSKHYINLVEIQQKWNVPVWVGEFAYMTFDEKTLRAVRIIFERLYGTRYLMETNAAEIVNETGWGWGHFEYAEVSFTDERLNSIYNRFFKGIWKPSSPAPKLKAVGNEIMTENGERVLLKGQNLHLKYLSRFGWLLPTEELFEKFDLMGLNVIRLVIAPEELMPEQGVWNTNSLIAINQTLNLAEEHGIYVVVDLTQWRSSSYWGGHGFPEWYVKRYNFTKSEEDRINFAKMWQNREPPFQDSWEFLGMMWTKMIEITRYRNIVFAYDLMNEMYWNTIAVSEYLSDFIYPLDDPEKIHLVQTPFLFYDMMTKNITDAYKPNIHNMVLSPHFYGELMLPSYVVFRNGIILTTVAFLILAIIIISIHLIKKHIVLEKTLSK